MCSSDLHLIDTIDPDGIALRAIQALHEREEALAEEVRRHAGRERELTDRIARLSDEVDRLRARHRSGAGPSWGQRIRRLAGRLRRRPDDH